MLKKFRLFFARAGWYTPQVRANEQGYLCCPFCRGDIYFGGVIPSCLQCKVFLEDALKESHG